MCIRDSPATATRAPSSAKRLAIPVSYTHLDVYKRQAKARPGALLQAEQRRIGADERSAGIDAAANDAFAAHAVAPEPASSPASARAGSIASDASSGASAAESSRNGARRTGNAAASAVILSLIHI